MDRVGLYARELTINEAEEIYEKHLRRDFPPDEVKPFSIIRKMSSKRNYYMYGFQFVIAAHTLLYLFNQYKCNRIRSKLYSFLGLVFLYFLILKASPTERSQASPSALWRRAAVTFLIK